VWVFCFDAVLLGWRVFYTRLCGFGSLVAGSLCVRLENLFSGVQLFVSRLSVCVGFWMV